MIVSKTVFDLLKPMPPFIRPLRDANREGRKTQTRRVVKEQTRMRYVDGNVEYLNMYGGWQEWVSNAKSFRCPYGKAGDLRYMREPLFKGPFDFAHYADDKHVAFSLLTGEAIKWRWKKDVLSQLYMPKEAARTFKKYEFIRAERLQKISEDDCIAEGVELTKGYFEIGLPDSHHIGHVSTNSARAAYHVLWDAINSDRGFEWNSNPWVWVIGYGEFALTLPSPAGRGEHMEVSHEA